MSPVDLKISEDISQGWQDLLNIAAKLSGVPAAVLMRFHPKIQKFEVYKRSEGKENPFREHDLYDLHEDSRLYCEEVIRTQKKLLVANALLDPKWKESPVTQSGLIAYLGLPLTYPDGTPFGSICLLDQKENTFAGEPEKLLLGFQKIINQHLELIYDREEISEQKNLSKAIMEKEPIGITLFNENSEAVYSNQMAREIFRLEEEYDVPRLISEVSFVDSYNRKIPLSEMPYSLIKKKPSIQNFFCGIIFPDGEKKYLSVNAQRLQSIDGKSGGHIETYNDITETYKLSRKNEAISRKIYDTKHLEALGKMAGGMAHNLNNLLTPIVGYSEMFFDQFKQNHPEAEEIEFLNEIQNAAEKARLLIQQILDFSRPHADKLKVFSLNEILTHFGGLIRQSVSRTVDIQYQLSPETLLSQVDEHQLQKVILSLVLNALEAGATKIRIESRSVLKSKIKNKECCRFAKESLPEKLNLIRISDNGSGISVEDSARLFEPFFTTKEKSVGMGLSVALGILKSYGGEIFAENRPEGGAAISLLLPVHEIQEKAEQKNEVRILVVDDFEENALMMKIFLESKGFTAQTAFRSESALKISEEFAPDILLADMNLPDENGIVLSKKMKKAFPELKIILMSGAKELPESEFDEEVRNLPFLNKPFDLKKLESIIEKTLAETPVML